MSAVNIETTTHALEAENAPQLLHPPRERGVLVPAIDIGFGDPDPLGGKLVV